MGLPQFVLASASPARRRLLQMVGIEPIVRVSNFDESQIKTENATKLVETLARCKAEAIAPQFDSALIVGCDSVLLLNGEIHGKPENTEVAIARWQQMSGQIGELYTGHTIIDQPQQQILVRTQVTRVYFAQMSDRAIRAYVASGEPLKCAGAFALEGRGGLFVDKIEGCHSNVIGLSLPLLRQMLSQLGYEVTDFWKR
ncbi:MAG: Nucleoside triphosphate pyrophosphatase [Chroococcidiopsis sp. SAG 2025]|uniref:Maf family protein n=1 Tax=Chroococcidiopsis sp. SAG 2025 TaxID=171389 RepID=UPI00293731B1|nr:nucleoside triphosphate pyrophosphatase [Chroococcidiopsis sp. SAG 2025]MDV2995094.1 Nucleoside triphosphate pyrophosphatase [Chroococcidiopsis sp. SAG 2025]